MGFQNILGLGQKKQFLNLLSFINHQPDIYKMYLYVRYPHESKDQAFIKKPENIGLKRLKDPKDNLSHFLWS